MGTEDRPGLLSCAVGLTRAWVHHKPDVGRLGASSVPAAGSQRLQSRRTARHTCAPGGTAVLSGHLLLSSRVWLVLGCCGQLANHSGACGRVGLRAAIEGT